MIKLCDLTKQPEEIYKAVENVLKSGRYVKGYLVEEFEEKWAKKCGMEYAIGVSSGATALELAITCIIHHSAITYSPYTFKAVPNAIIRMNPEANALPNINEPDIFDHHLHESKLDYKPFLEDCSHAHGYRPVAQTAIFSLFPTKILGACGDAGVIVTNSKNVYEKCLYLRSHGVPNGTNARMDEIQASVLLTKLPYLDEWIARRKKIVDIYDEALGRKTPGQFHYAYCIPGSEQKKSQLIEMGVESAFYYSPEYMALPLHPYLTNLEVEEVIACVRQLK